MCGILGLAGSILQTTKESEFAEWLALLNHRGPDTHGVFWRPNEAIGLGHTRLSIIDLSTANDQPFQTNRCTTVFNGEIYNFIRLREELERHGVEFWSEGDTEVIARGYEHWGVEVFSRLEGMFAIALFDKNTGETHLSRDMFGIKPLYLKRLGASGVMFSSEIAPLAHSSDTSFADDTLVDLGSWGFPISLRSTFKNIEHIPPGEVVTLKVTTNDVIIKETKHQPLRALYSGKLTSTARNRLEDTLTNSVRDHLIADVPVAIALSGGIDSSIIAALAARERANLTAFTITTSVDPYVDEEVQHAHLVCQKSRIRHQLVRLEVTDLEAYLRSIVYHLGEPVVNINALMTYALGAAVRQAGFKVILMGEGSDELFAGYPWHKFALDPKTGATTSLLFDAYLERRAQPGGLQKFFSASALRSTGVALDRQKDTFIKSCSATNSSPLNNLLHFDQEYQLQHSQLHRVDRMMMAHSVEARVPFLYESVADLSAHLLDSDKITRASNSIGRTDKIVLAECFGDILPVEVRDRPKFGPRGTVNLFATELVRQIDFVFECVSTSAAYKGSREVLSDVITWDQINPSGLTQKEKLFLILTTMTADLHILNSPAPIQGSGFKLY